MNRLYPIFLKLEGRLCVVVGGGKVAQRKARGLLECGATVRVVSPEVEPNLWELEAKGRIEWVRREFQAGDLEGASLVVAATDREPVNAQIYEEARKAGVLCNVVDQPERCDFYVPAVAQQGDLKIAVSGNGRSGGLVAGIRRMLQEQFGEEYGRVLAEAGRLRDAVRRKCPENPARRAEILARLVRADEVLDALRNGDRGKIDAVLESWTSFSSD